MKLPLADLEALYERAPKVHCKGLCANACSAIGVSPAEWRRMERRGGRIGEQPRALADGVLVTSERRCRYLSGEGRCTVYDVRPMVCRLWGGTELMPCPHGCEVEGFIEEPEGLGLLQDALHAGGAKADGERIRKRWREDPEYREFTRQMMRAAFAVDAGMEER